MCFHITSHSANEMMKKKLEVRKKGQNLYLITQLMKLIVSSKYEVTPSIRQFNQNFIYLKKEKKLKA